ncbi:class I SAM-dependent methyltransferase [bacterium]|nr:class I SAM-dependent methyltransferase [bacterium]
MPPSQEVERIERVYAERARRLPADFYSIMKPGNLYRLQRRERDLLALLHREGFADLDGVTVLDVGCGTGDDLRQMLRYGARSEHLVGVDVQSDRLSRARDLSPHLRFELIDGGVLPFPTGSFDLVMQSTVFSSILDHGVQARLAQEMLRVLSPGGAIIWYDMRVTNPRNSNLTPLTLDRIEALFPDCELHLKPHTLIPALGRRLAPLSWTLCRALEALPPLRGHLLGAIRPHGTVRS